MAPESPRPGTPARHHTARNSVWGRSPPRAVTAAQAEPSGALRKAATTHHASRRPRDLGLARGSPAPRESVPPLAPPPRLAYSPPRRGRMAVTGAGIVEVLSETLRVAPALSASPSARPAAPFSRRRAGHAVSNREGLYLNTGPGARGRVVADGVPCKEPRFDLPSCSGGTLPVTLAVAIRTGEGLGSIQGGRLAQAKALTLGQSFF